MSASKYSVIVTPATTENSYSNGDQVGAIQEVDLKERAFKINGILASLVRVEQPGISFLIFDSDPNAAVSSGDGDALAITDAGVRQAIAHARVPASSWFLIGAAANVFAPTEVPIVGYSETKKLWVLSFTTSVGNLVDGELQYIFDIDTNRRK